MASSSRNPAIAWSQKSEMPSTSRATLIVPSSRAPIAAPTALPLPPKIATPPTTTEAITISEKLVPPALVLIVWYWAAHSTPPTPAIPPHKVKAVNTRLATGTPASRAPSGFDPIA